MKLTPIILITIIMFASCGEITLFTSNSLIAIPLIKPPKAVLGSRIGVPPLDPSNIFILAYYNAGTHLDISTTANNLMKNYDATIIRRGSKYFDAVIKIYDPAGLPAGYYDLFLNASITELSYFILSISLYPSRFSETVLATSST